MVLRFVTATMPKSFGKKVQNKLKADAMSVPLGSNCPHYYELGMKLAIVSLIPSLLAECPLLSVTDTEQRTKQISDKLLPILPADGSGRGWSGSGAGSELCFLAPRAGHPSKLPRASAHVLCEYWL